MKIDKIYFGMDGVLADFDRGLREICGIEPVDQSKDDKTADDAMWTAVREADHFYYNLKSIFGAIEMVKLALEKYGSSCQILSAIPKEHRGIVDAASDKERWIREYVSPDMIVNICKRKEDKKKKALNKCCVLVDDLKANITDWETAGGTGILFISVEDVIRELMDE